MSVDISSEIAALARARMSKASPAKAPAGRWETGERNGILYVKGLTDSFVHAPAKPMRLVVRKFELFGFASAETNFAPQHEIAGIAEIVDDSLSVAGTDKIAKEIEIGVKPALESTPAKGQAELRGQVDLGHVEADPANHVPESWYVQVHVPSAVIDEIRERYRRGTIQEFELRLSTGLWINASDIRSSTEPVRWYFNPQQLTATGKLEGIAWREAPPGLG